jgi:protoporphyrinogen oxidase
MNQPLPRVAVLGAGPAGLGAAWRLRQANRAAVTVVEQHSSPGGNAGSFEFAGLNVDYGSHRLHPASDPAILADLRQLLGDDLLDRPRHGRIRLRGRWIHFPLKPVDLMLRLDPGFALGSAVDALTKPLRGAATRDTFASVLRTNLGPTICDHFYFPYARKIWGRDPDELSGIQARRRVGAGSVGKLIRKVLAQVPGLKKPGTGRFYYPRGGFGQISQAIADRAASLGAEMRYGRKVTSLEAPTASRPSWIVGTTGAAGEEALEADYLWSTLPIPLIARIATGVSTDTARDAAAKLSYRSMILVYLELPIDQFTEFDAHYFPGADVKITRLSEPKNYAARREPAGRTVLCAELPGAPTDPWWTMSDAELGDLVADDLARSGIPLPARPSSVAVRRLPQAYPIYTIGYEEPFQALDRWAESLPAFLSFGRQGLFAHDNTHHALAMAYAAAECLEPGGFNRDRWAQHRAVFETHVVED